MADMLKILVQADLNIGASIGNINEKLKALSKHPSLQSLNIKINIDKSFVASMNSFVSAANKLNLAMEQQNKIVSETTTTYKRLDGSIEKVTQQRLADNSVITKTNKTVDEHRLKLQQETEAYDKQRKSIQQLESELKGYALANEKAIKNGKGQVVGYKNTYENKETGQKVTANIDQNGIVKKYDEIINHAKTLKDQESLVNQMYDGRIKSMERVNTAERQLATNQQKAIQENADRQRAADKKNQDAIQATRKEYQDWWVRSLGQQEVAERQANQKKIQNLKEFKQQAETNAQRLNTKYGSSVNQTDLSSLLSSASKLDINDANLKQKMKQIQQGFRDVESSAKSASTQVASFGEKVSHAIKSIGAHMIAGALYGTVFSSITAGFKGMIDIESHMAGYIQTNEHYFQGLQKGSLDMQKVNNESRQFIQTAHDQAAAITDVIESARLWGRMYKDVGVVQTLVRQSTMLSTVDLVSLEDATKSMESVLAQYGVQLKNTNDAQLYGGRILDSWSKVAHETMAPARDLGAAFERTGKIAQETGVSFDFMNGLISSGMRNTALSGENLGNMWKTVLGTIRTSKAVNEIESLGVETKKVVNGVEEWRKAEDILLDLSIAVIDKNYDLTQSYAAISRGVYQYAKLAASLQPGDILLGTAYSIGSTGSTLEYLTTQMDTISRKASQVKTSFIDIFNTAGNDGLRSMIKTILDITDQLFIGMSKIPSSIFGVSTAIVALGAAFVALKSPIKTAIDSMIVVKAMRQGMIVVTNEETAAVTASSVANAAHAVTSRTASTAEVGRTVATEATTVAINAQTAASARAAVTTSIATMGISVVIGLLASLAVGLGTAEKAQRDETQQINDSIEARERQINQYKRQIDFLPKVADAINKYKKAMDGGTLSAQQQATAQKQLEEMYKAVGITATEEGLKRLKAAHFSEDAVKYEIELLKQKKQAAAEANTEAARGAYDKKKNEYENNEEALKKAKEDLKKYKNDLDTIMNDNSIAGAFAKSPETIQGYYQMIAMAQSKVDEFTGKQQTLSKELDDANQKYMTNIEATDQLAGADSKMANATDDASDAFEKLNKALDDSSSELKTLNQALYDQQKNGYLSAETVAELIKKNPQLAASVKKVKDGYILETEAVNDLREAQLKMIKQSIEGDKQRSLNAINASISTINGYGLELKSVKDLADAKKALAAIEDEIANAKIAALSPEMRKGLGYEEKFDFNLGKTVYYNPMFEEARKARNDALKEQYDEISKSVQELEEKASKGKELLGIYSDPNFGISKEATKKNDQYNDSLSETNEILTETQKKLKAIAAAQDAQTSRMSRLKKGTEEYGKALKEQIKLLEKQAELYTEGIKDPSKLVSTKVTTTTKGGTGLDSMIEEALSLSSSGAFKYKQINGEYKGTYDEFVQRATSDCSQFVQEMFKEFLNIKLPRTAAEQAKQGTAVTSKKELQKGDLVFFNTNGKAHSHVGVYMGDGNFMQMGNSGLKQGNLNDKYWATRYDGATRIPGASALPTSTSVASSSKVTGKNADLINKYASTNGVDPALIKAIIQQESGNGANGIKNVMQVSSLGKNTNVESSIKTGTSMFAKYLNQTGNVEIALAMYNMGPGILDYFNKNGGYSVENMKKFSAKQKQKTGSKVYGDVNYVGNVLRYYDGDTSSVSGGKSKNKYTLPSASDLAKAQEDARKNRTTTYDNIYKARVDYIENYVTMSQNKLDALDADIAKSQGRQAKYDQVSANWRKEESSQIKSLTAQQKELVSQNINLDNLVKQNKITSGEFDKQKASNSTKWWELEQQKQEKYYAVIVSNLDEYEKKINAAADKIALSKARMESLDENSKAYQQELITQIGLINEQRVATEKEILAVERQLKNEKLNLQNKEELSKRLQDLTLKNLEYNNAIYSIKSAAADKIIEAYKKQIEKQKDLALKAIDKQKEAEDKRHEARLKNLEEESDRFEEIIKRQLQELDRTSESDDYDKELKKKLDERQKIQDKINELALNNSYEAKAKRKDLTDQLDAKNEEIDKFKLDRERELRKEGLNDQLEDRKKYLDKTKDAEDRTHDAITDNIDREKELTEQKYDDILEDEQRFYRMKQDLMSNDKTKVKSVIDELKGEYSKFFTFLQEQSLETSKQMQNMLDSLSMDQGKLNDFLNLDSGIGNNTGIGTGDGNGNGSGNGSNKEKEKGDWQKYLSNKQKAESISKQVVQLQREKKPDNNKIKSLQAQFQSLKSENDAMRSKWGFPDGSYDYLVKQKVFSADTGGMTPTFSGGKFLLAHEKELVLNKSDTGNLLKIIDVTRGIVDSVKSTFTPNFVRNNNTSTASNVNSFHFEKVEIHANDKESGSNILTKLIDAAKTQSKRGVLGNNYGFNL
ncbi:C40 family peptidase [Paenibacillus sp. EKM102P]|uniref:NlpC/P60 family protein n=1 Tax=unclassified Paenibacillus TaxID=185978 RepID=UPI00142D210E|nr:MULTISPECIES: NlpC/P60 family protein [unclassified Paenibacillus]KAF6620431.1 C40 family peptidase [Paenibacillus sp. EKM101P]KAF6623423.1 C40 family peptidase [Paenibacillus sp. EKM102P]KAF6634015.1 C40 family peptidase [Paenibacillus sp. EKM10P]KAF6649541.1 C40 family peptidase [Paenibacillus sp. EKM11P]